MTAAGPICDTQIESNGAERIHHSLRSLPLLFAGRQQNVDDNKVVGSNIISVSSPELEYWRL